MTDNGGNRRDSFLEFDDGLEGADDFTTEPNPFDDVVSDDMSKKGKPPGYEGTTDTATLPPGYDEAINEPAPTASQPRRETLPPGLLNYLSQYFQLNDQELKTNLYDSLKFKLTQETDQENRGDLDTKPDLYGPVWIFATIVAANFVGSKLFAVILGGIFAGVRDTTDTFGGNRLIHSFWLYLTYSFFIPAIIAKMYLHRKESIAELISAFGYSTLVWIPVGLIIDLIQTLHSAMPIYVLSIVKWVLVALAFAKSSQFLYRKMNTEDSSDQLVKFPIIGFNAIMCVVARLLLYSS